MRMTKRIRNRLLVATIAAGALGLSEVTVKIHRGSAMRKMRARTLADLVRMAEALGLSVTVG